MLLRCLNSVRAGQISKPWPKNVRLCWERSVITTRSVITLPVSPTKQIPLATSLLIFLTMLHGILLKYLHGGNCDSNLTLPVRINLMHHLSASPFSSCDVVRTASTYCLTVVKKLLSASWDWKKGGTLGLLSPMSILEVLDIEIAPFKKALSRQVWNKSTYILIMGHSTI